MKLLREKQKAYRTPLMITAFSIGAVALLGLWAVQIYFMVQNGSFENVAASVEDTKGQIQEGTEFADQLQGETTVAVPALLTQFQEAAEQELNKQLIIDKAAAAMIDELETNQALDQTYAEEIE